MAEELEDTEERFWKEDLVYVKTEDDSYRGWRLELLKEKLSSRVEEKLLMCTFCKGLLREACICQEEFKCRICIPRGAPWQPVKVNREIVNEKMIRCPLKGSGCDWSYTVKTVLHHLDECKFLSVVCPLGCAVLEGERKGKVVKIERRHILEHQIDSCPLRKIICEFCNDKVEACWMNPHLEVCEDFPVPCPNGCGTNGKEGMKRRDIPAHLSNECPLQIIQCIYWNNGCREEMERRELKHHEKESLHIHFRLSMIDMQDKLDTAISQLAKATERISTLEEQNQELSTKVSIGEFEWKIGNVKMKILRKETSYSDPFYVGLYKCQGRIVWDFANTGKVGCFILIMKGNYDHMLHWPIKYKWTFVLLNQINNEDNFVYSDEVTKKDLDKYPNSFKRPAKLRNGGFGTRTFISNTGILEEKYYREHNITLQITVKQLSIF
ncbi:TNF receptor-associated factor 4-like [Oopsacas minuta]|uniref:TNF receptor-associated factor 4-like n=1 Tax=Oopsacas minuta TaxID=111878 RepID=A0AAV7JGS4_9METZ|nr:TNF receptor-associated factor 4-like [Oopsacas minuta]